MKENLNVLTNFEKINFKKNFVFCALNLAYVSYKLNGKIKKIKNVFLWCDGIFAKLFVNSKKIPGSKILNYFIKNKYINQIVVIGSSSKNQKKYLINKFKLKVKIINLPNIRFDDLKNFVPKLSKSSLILITLPTPKQEEFARQIIKKNKYYKIICIGGGLAIASGDIKDCPKFMNKLGLEFIWRLRTDTTRRLARLFYSFIIFCFFKLIGKTKELNFIKN